MWWTGDFVERLSFTALGTSKYHKHIIKQCTKKRKKRKRVSEGYLLLLQKAVQSSSLGIPGMKWGMQQIAWTHLEPLHSHYTLQTLSVSIFPGKKTPTSKQLKQCCVSNSMVVFSIYFHCTNSRNDSVSLLQCDVLHSNTTPCRGIPSVNTWMMYNSTR